MKLPIQLLLVAAGAAWLPACSCLPAIDRVSLQAAATGAVSAPRGGDANVEVSYSDSEVARHAEGDGNLHTKSNNTYTPPTYVTVAGASRSISCKWATGSQKPPVTWYRNGPLAGAIESTATGLTSGYHYVRFYNATDKKWFPAKAIKVDLSRAGRQATIKVKVTP